MIFKRLIQIGPFLLVLFLVSSTVKAEKQLRFGIASIISPTNSFVRYRGLSEYLGKEARRNIQPVLQQNYEEMNQMLESGRVDFALICTGATLYLNPSKAKVMALPVERGQARYQSYIIVHQASEISSMKELRGKSFAFTDRLSNSGAFYPKHLLRTMGEKPSRFFKKIYYTGSHDKSIFLINQGAVDGAAIDNLVYYYLAEEKPDEVRNIRIIHRSPKFETPPIVAASSLEPKLFSKFQTILLKMHEMPDGRKILKKLKIDRFKKPESVHFFDFKSHFGKEYGQVD